MTIIIPCVIGLFKDEDKTGSIMGILLGVALLLCVQNIIAWGMLLKFMLSAVLVIIGLNIIFKDVA